MRSPRLLPLLLPLVLAACGGAPRSPDTAASASEAPLAFTCDSLPAPDPVIHAPIDPRSPDGALFDTAMREATNRVRCENGLPPLQGDPALARAAAIHSADMTRERFFSHQSPVRGRATPADRFHETGVRFRRAAENIAITSFMAFEDQRYFIRDPAKCDFSFTPGGPSIPPRSYASAAASVLRGWLDSPGHRRNVLDGAVTRHGAGLAFRADPANCGDLLVTQTFAG